MEQDSRPLRRFAVSRLYLPGGQVLRNQVIEITVASDGKTTARYFPLTQELAFTEWRGGSYHWPTAAE